MVVYIGCDHGGLELKRAIVERLSARGTEVRDMGTYSNASCDYPDFAIAVGRNVAADADSRGIVICRSGVGMSIAANKVKGVRCALCFNAEMGRLCREHNDANCLALGADNTDKETAFDIIDTFLSAKFAGGRHQNRVNKITEYEERDD